MGEKRLKSSLHLACIISEGQLNQLLALFTALCMGSYSMFQERQACSRQYLSTVPQAFSLAQTIEKNQALFARASKMLRSPHSRKYLRMLCVATLAFGQHVRKSARIT